jgi:hypothetical protein
MKPIARKTVLSFFINGGICTLLMMGFHYADDDIKHGWQYAIQFVIFGGTMAYLSYRSLKKQHVDSNDN